jgi:FkbM family methyltransferase
MKNKKTGISGRIAAGILRRLILLSRRGGALGQIGKFFGCKIGWPLEDGIRIAITNPDDFIQQRLLIHRSWERNIINVMHALLRPGDAFFDVGANIGYHTLLAAGRGAFVHAFEPHPRLATNAKANIKMNGLEKMVVFKECAIGRSVETASLFLAESPNEDVKHSMIQENSGQKSIKVPVITLDGYFRDANCKAPALIKIDVEGFEARVLDGARGLISEFRPAIIIETADRLADHIGESARAVTGRIFKSGYRIFLFCDDNTGNIMEIGPEDVSGECRNYLALHISSPLIETITKEPFFIRAASAKPEKTGF